MPLRIDWARFPDGVHFSGEGRGRAWQPETTRTERLPLDIRNLEDPIALKFINAGSDEKLLGGFLRRFGPPKRAPFSTRLDDLKELQAELLGILRTDVGKPAEQAGRLNACLTDTQLRPSAEVTEGGVRISVQADDLFSFMAMEMASAVEAGASLATCDHCGTHYLTGPLTGRRSHSKFCSDKCRVAAMRERNREGSQNGTR